MNAKLRKITRSSRRIKVTAIENIFVYRTINATAGSHS